MLYKLILIPFITMILMFMLGSFMSKYVLFDLKSFSKETLVFAGETCCMIGIVLASLSLIFLITLMVDAVPMPLPTTTLASDILGLGLGMVYSSFKEWLAWVETRATSSPLPAGN